MIRVHIKYKGGEMPPAEDGPLYIVAKEGTFLRKQTTWARGIVPVQRISILQSQESEFELLLPKIPRMLMLRVAKLFSDIYQAYWTEAAVYLHYHAEMGWSFSLPHQTVTPMSVHYGSPEPQGEGWATIGTIHSHAGMEAFHSGVDRDDETDFDGIHITLGQFTRMPVLDVSAEAVMNGSRFPFAIDECVEDVDHVDYVPVQRFIGRAFAQRLNMTLRDGEELGELPAWNEKVLKQAPPTYSHGEAKQIEEGPIEAVVNDLVEAVAPEWSPRLGLPSPRPLRQEFTHPLPVRGLQVNKEEN